MSHYHGWDPCSQPNSRVGIGVDRWFMILEINNIRNIENILKFGQYWCQYYGIYIVLNISKFNMIFPIITITTDI